MTAEVLHLTGCTTRQVERGKTKACRRNRSTLEIKGFLGLGLLKVQQFSMREHEDGVQVRVSMKRNEGKREGIEGTKGMGLRPLGWLLNQRKQI